MIVKVDHGPIRELRMNRPPVNALTTEFMSEIRQAIEHAADDGIRAVVISGMPGVFSAGLDLPLLLGLDRSGIESLWRELYAFMKALATSPVPIAAAITGHALAGGTVIPLFCDWRIVAQGDFKLGLTEVAVGIPLPQFILLALGRQVGPRRAERLAVEGTIISPDDALAMGLIEELAPPDQVAPRAVEWCRKLVALPSGAMLDTRSRARADLVALFDDSEEELRRGIDAWWSAETQKMLRTVVERMRKK